jgi:integrase
MGSVEKRRQQLADGTQGKVTWRARYFGTAQLGAIDYLDVEHFMADKPRSGHGPKQVRETVTILSLIMKCAVKANARKDNPAAGHELRVPARRATQVPMLTMEQAASLVEHTSDHYQSARWLLIFTGMRPAELCGLRVEDLDLVRRVVHVRRTWSPVPGFDGGSLECVEGPVKSDAGQRSIPIPLWLCKDLAADRAVNRDTFRATVVRPALRAAGLPDDFRTYDIRHSHASLLIDDDANVLAVAQRMGHSDPAVTLRIYGHLFEGVQEELTDRLDRRRQAALRPTPSQAAPVVGLRRERPGRR